MWYELWDSETGNRFGKYPTEDAALLVVLEEIRLDGRDARTIVSLGLLRRDPNRQQGRSIAEGTALVERALALASVDSANDVATTTSRRSSPEVSHVR